MTFIFSILVMLPIWRPGALIFQGSKAKRLIILQPANLWNLVALLPVFTLIFWFLQDWEHHKNVIINLPCQHFQNVPLGSAQAANGGYCVPPWQRET